MTESSLTPALPQSISIYADRAVSTQSARFVHGIVPLIREQLAKGFELAYIARERIADATGLNAGHMLVDYYPQQLEEVGIVARVETGRFGLHERKDGTTRGVASGWVIDEDGYTPTDVPVMELVTEPFHVHVQMSTVDTCMSPIHWVWAKEQRAHRLACALLHHAGLNRVWLTSKQAGEILGCNRVTGWKALKDLERIGYAEPHDGGWWVDLSAQLYDETMYEPHEDVQQQAEEHALLRTSVFTKEGREARQTAREARRILALARERGDVVRPEYAAAVGRSLRQAVLYFARLFRDDPYATGIPHGI